MNGVRLAAQGGERGRYAGQAFAGARLCGQYICHARLRTPTLWAISYAGSVFPHLCYLFVLSAFTRWEHLIEMQPCAAIPRVSVARQTQGSPAASMERASTRCGDGSRTSRSQE